MDKQRQPNLNAWVSAPPRTPIIRPTLTYQEARLSFKVRLVHGGLWQLIKLLRARWRQTVILLFLNLYQGHSIYDNASQFHLIKKIMGKG